MENTDRLVNYMRVRRKAAGLSQRELAQILGYESRGAVMRHELFRSVPPLLMALAYEVIFQAPVADLFPGLRAAVEHAMEKSLTEFERALQDRVKSGHVALSAIEKRKLAWLGERRRAPSARK